MIKFSAKSESGGKDLIGIGLSEANIQRLKGGSPIIFEGTEVGLPGHSFLIYVGPTEKEMYHDLKSGQIKIGSEIISLKAMRKS
jgi:hypothetical protein